MVIYQDYLWAVSRMKWVKPKNPYKGCVFCAIAKKDDRVPRKIVYEEKDFMVVMNIFPYNVGHVQVVPRRHMVWLEEMTEEEFKRFFELVKKSVVMLRKALNPKGFNIGFNLGGVVSGGSIMHLHAQIVPRYEKEIGFMESLSGVKVMPQTLEQTFKILKKHAKILEK